MLKSILGKAAAVAEQVADSARDTTSAVQAAVTSSLPDAATIKRGVGRVLITGGKLLVDPKATVGEIAIALGEDLAGGQAPSEWLVLEATAAGFEPLCRGPEDAVRAAYEAAVASGRTVLLCQVQAASA